MRLWQRVLVRSGLSVRYSQGFNPRIKMSLPLPRSVGVASEVELLLVEVNESLETEGLVELLNTFLPENICAVEAAMVSANIPALPLWAEYTFELTDQTDRQKLAKNIEGFHTAPEWIIDRASRKRHKRRTVDLCESVTKLRCPASGDTFSCRVDIQEQGTARLGELLEALELSATEEIRNITRTAAGFPTGLG